MENYHEHLDHTQLDRQGKYREFDQKGRCNPEQISKMLDVNCVKDSDLTLESGFKTPNCYNYYAQVRSPFSRVLDNFELG
jgi:hypothetical protein